MPSNASVAVTAALVSNPAVTASYTMTLINPVPTIYGIQPSQLLTAGTNTVSVSGSGFVAGTTILQGSTPLATTYQSPTAVVVQIPVSNTATGSVPLTAQNPTPGGGPSNLFQAPIATGSIQLTAYNSDGTNTGTARLGRSVSIVPAVQGSNNSTLTWTVTGAGTVSSNGVYSAPPSMPSNASVVVTAALVSNPAVTASYTMTLINPLPILNALSPWELTTATTNSITITGSGFMPGTVVFANGMAVTTTYQSPTSVVTQIPVGNAVQGSIPLTAQNPAPGGGTSVAYLAPIEPLTIQLTANSQSGANPTTDPLGLSVQFFATVHGSGDSTSNPTVNWSVQGAGTISSSGVYLAPSTMPSNSTVTVVSTLAANTTVSTSYTLSLVNPIPVLNASSPTQVQAGITNSVTFSGIGFTPNTILLVDGGAVAATYQSGTSIVAQIPVSSDATGPLQVTAQNPAPGGGMGSAFSLFLANTSAAAATIGTTPGVSIPLNFLGLSHEWGDAEWFMGSSQYGVNAIYYQLVQNLINPGSSLLIRIG
jgi:hypothetical protein